MARIMAHLQQIVPVRSLNYTILDPSNDDKAEVIEDTFTYFFGDQLTVERATESQINSNDEWRGVDRLEGLIPVIEDWHAKVCFLYIISTLIILKYLLQAIWRALYRNSSGSNSGTLCHLRNLIQRRTVSVTINSDPMRGLFLTCCKGSHH